MLGFIFFCLFYFFQSLFCILQRKNGKMYSVEAVNVQYCRVKYYLNVSVDFSFCCKPHGFSVFQMFFQPQLSKHRSSDQVPSPNTNTDLIVN